MIERPLRIRQGFSIGNIIFIVTLELSTAATATASSTTATPASTATSSSTATAAIKTTEACKA